MRDIKKILVPTDFSEGSGAACSTAEKLAFIFDAKVDLIHIIPSMKYWNESLKRIGLPLDLNEDVYPRIIEETELQIENVLQTHLDAKIRGKYYVKIDRKPYHAITEFALKNRYDLIVIGAKGEDESGFFRGSTTEKVIRHSKVPVFAIDQELNEKNVHNILVPTDGSQLSFAVFPIAVKLAAIFGLKITLFYAVELYGTIAVHFPDQYNYENIERDAVYNTIIKKLKKFIQEEKDTGITIEPGERGFEDQVIYQAGENKYTIPMRTVIKKGFSAHYEIEKYAQENADIVAIATHGRSGLAHLIMGSTAEKVVQYVNKPVITVRPEKKMFKS